MDKIVISRASGGGEVFHSPAAFLGFSVVWSQPLWPVILSLPRLAGRIMVAATWCMPLNPSSGMIQCACLHHTRLVAS